MHEHVHDAVVSVKYSDFWGLYRFDAQGHRALNMGENEMNDEKDYEKGFLWPKKNHIAFGTDSCQDYNLPTTVFLDDFIFHPSLEVHANAFREAADMIVTGVEKGQSHFNGDKLFFPIAYLYRHAIELLLKEAIGYGIKLYFIRRDQQLEEILNDHNLYKLWNKLKPALATFWYKAETDSPSAAERIISQFHEFDKSGQEFRYPTTKNGKSSLKNKLNETKVIDLKQLSKVAGGLCEFLEGCIAGFDDALSNMPEREWQ